MGTPAGARSAPFRPGGHAPAAASRRSRRVAARRKSFGHGHAHGTGSASAGGTATEALAPTADVLLVIGPGIITANADNDVGGIQTYSIAGAQFGYSMLWLLIPVTPR
jgi:hypothetical protein